MQAMHVERVNGYMESNNKWLNSGLLLVNCALAYFSANNQAISYLKCVQTTPDLPLIQREESEPYMLRICFNSESQGFRAERRATTDKSFVHQQSSCCLCLFVFISRATAAVHESALAQQTVNEHCN